MKSNEDKTVDSIVFFFLQDGRGEKRDGDNSADSG